MSKGCKKSSSWFFSSRRRHTRYWRDWSSDVCSSDLRTATVLHTPMESHQAVCRWAGDALEAYVSTQWIWGARDELAEAFGLPPDNVRVVCRSEERRVGKECRSRWAPYH